MDLTSMSFNSQNKRRFGLSFMSPVAIFQPAQKLSAPDYSHFAYNIELNSSNINSHKMCGGNVQVLNEVSVGSGKTGTCPISNFGSSLRNATHALLKVGKTLPKRDICHQSNQFPSINVTSLVGGFVGSKSQVGLASRESCQIWDIVICLLDEVMRHSPVHRDSVGLVDSCISQPRREEELLPKNFSKTENCKLHFQSDFVSNKFESYNMLHSSNSNKADKAFTSKEHTAGINTSETLSTSSCLSDNMKSYADVAKSAAVKADVQVRAEAPSKQSIYLCQKKDIQRNLKSHFNKKNGGNRMKNSNFEFRKQDNYRSTKNKNFAFSGNHFQKINSNKGCNNSYKIFSPSNNSTNRKFFKNVEICNKESTKHSLKPSCILTGDSFHKSSKESETFSKSDLNQRTMKTQHTLPDSHMEKNKESYLNSSDISHSARSTEHVGENSISVPNKTSNSVNPDLEINETLDTVCSIFHLLPSFHKFQRRCSSECSLDSDDSFIVFDEQCPGDDNEDSFFSMCDEETDNSCEETEECDNVFIDSGDEQNSFSSMSQCSLEEINEKWQKENSLVPATEKFPERVSFAESDVVYPMIAWNFAYRAARRGPWEQIALDRTRFQNRVSALGEILQPILLPEHRCQIWKKRIMKCM